MEIVFLDQNKWIELAQVHSGRTTSGPIAQLFSQLVSAVQVQRVLFPLTVSNIIETAKRNDGDSRRYVAETQAILSRGYVHRSRAERIAVELRVVIQRRLGEDLAEIPPDWAFAPSFVLAFSPVAELRKLSETFSLVSNLISHTDPAMFYLDFMTNQNDDFRREGIAILTQKLSALVVRIESRRARFAGESMDFRRRLYAAHAWGESMDLLNQAVDELGYSFDKLRALGEQAIKGILDDVPTMNAEIEMAVRLEAKTGQLSVNDTFDMQSFYAALPYSDRMVAEKAAISRAKQAKLDCLYDVVLSRSLEDLLDLYID